MLRGKPGTKKWLYVKQMKRTKFGGGGGGMGSEHREGELAGQPSIHFHSLSPSQTLLTRPSSQARPRDSVLAMKMPCGIVGQKLLWSGCAPCCLPFCQLKAEAVATGEGEPYARRKLGLFMPLGCCLSGNTLVFLCSVYWCFSLFIAAV